MKRIFLLILLIMFFAACATKQESVKTSGNIGGTGTYEGSKTKITEGKTTTKWDKKLEEERLKQEALKAEELKEKEMHETELINRAIENFASRDIHFDFDDFKIKANDIPYLESLGMWLKEHPAYRITVEGHCDERGSDLYNLALGQKRANSVKDFLVTFGINPDRIDTISYGEEKPLDPGHNEAAWAKNRRDHFVISK